MIRYTLLTLFVAFICVYAWKDWYKALCGVVVMLAVLERPDMPRAMLGVTGLNPWNIMLLFILLSWMVARVREGLRWDIPKWPQVLLGVYLLVVLISVGRLLADSSGATRFLLAGNLPLVSNADYVARYIVNGLKWVIPGLLIFHGCRTSDRLNWAVLSILATMFLLALQVIRWMPIGELTDSASLSDRAIRVLDRQIGYHRVDLAAILASGSWAFFVASRASVDALKRWAFLGGALMSLLGLALTGGRAGYVAWIFLGFVFAALRWRRYLILGPLILVIIVAVVPAARDRLLEGTGIGADPGYVDYDEASDLYAMTSGRAVVWPIVINKIRERPLIGYGSNGYQQSGAGNQVIHVHGSTLEFGHPHNAYLELIIDAGILGAIPILLFFGLIVRYSITLIRDQRSPAFLLVGGLGIALVLGQLVAALGSQSFYPRQGVVLMWCAIGLVLRVMVNRERLGAGKFGP